MKKITCLTLLIFVFLSLSVSAHSGNTDDKGGHKVSGTDEYHYHHGYPAHTHEVLCTYEIKREKHQIITATVLITSALAFILFIIWYIFIKKEDISPKLEKQVKTLKDDKRRMYFVISKHEKHANDLSHQLDVTKDQLNSNHSFYVREINNIKSSYENKLNSLTIEYKKKYKAINQRKIWLETWDKERFYIICTPSNKNTNYKLEADISLYMLFWFKVNEDTFEVVKERDTLYLLDRAYWSNGGHISFSDTLPQLQLNTPINVQSDDEKLYTVTLTDKKVASTQSELNELKRRETKLNRLISDAKKDINTLISEQEHSFPHFSKLLSDYRHYFNKQLALELETKKQPAKVSADNARVLADQMHKLEKEYKDLKYQMDFYESKFPELKELRKELKKKTN
ncbi:MAG: hypothetical protein IJ300_11300 [Clostridia bacterium]|nr:hypothetical protein [Clostridia bacterium]